MGELKEVRFDIWCPVCEHCDLDEKYTPCNECLEVGMREGTEKPEKFKEKE